MVAKLYWQTAQCSYYIAIMEIMHTGPLTVDSEDITEVM